IPDDFFSLVIIFSPSLHCGIPCLLPLLKQIILRAIGVGAYSAAQLCTVLRSKEQGNTGSDQCSSHKSYNFLIAKISAAHNIVLLQCLKKVELARGIIAKARRSSILGKNIGEDNRAQSRLRAQWRAMQRRQSPPSAQFRATYQMCCDSLCCKVDFVTRLRCSTRLRRSRSSRARLRIPLMMVLMFVSSCL